MRSSLHRRRHKLLSVGLSFLVNAVVFGVLAHMISVSSRPSERYLAVELESAPVVHIPPTATPKPKPIERISPVPESTIKPKPAAPDNTRRFFTLPITKNSPVKTVNPGPAGTTIAPTPASTSGGGGGTSVSGPGAPSGSGDGGGTTSSGSPGGHSAINTPDTGRGSGESRGGHENPAPTPAPPPAPKGESRSAKAVSQPKPAYPQDARDDGVEGTAVLLATIGADGRVIKAKVEKSSGDRRLDKAAENAVKRWTYSPCLKDGTPVESVVRVNVHFRLE